MSTRKTPRPSNLELYLKGVSLQYLPQTQGFHSGIPDKLGYYGILDMSDHLDLVELFVTKETLFLINSCFTFLGRTFLYFSSTIIVILTPEEWGVPNPSCMSIIGFPLQIWTTNPQSHSPVSDLSLCPLSIFEPFPHPSTRDLQKKGIMKSHGSQIDGQRHPKIILLAEVEKRDFIRIEHCENPS